MEDKRKLDMFDIGLIIHFVSSAIIGVFCIIYAVYSFMSRL